MTKIWNTVQAITSKLLGEKRAKVVVTALKKSWNGEEMLWRVFWVYGIGISFVLSLFFVMPLAATGGRLGESIALLITLPYNIWVLKSVWESVDNIENDEFKGIPKVYLSLAAKIAVVLGAVNLFFALFA